jgi:hypothetical protein
MYRLVLAALLTIVMLPAVAPAQTASPDTRLQMETKRRRLVARPEAPIATAIQDADRAAGEVLARQQVEREVSGDPRRHTQLDRDVTSAIQARHAQGALRR